MPSTPAMKRIENALSLYSKVIDFMHQQMGWIEEKNANALQALLYINANMAFIKNTSAYIPEDEVNLLLRTLGELEPYKTKNPWEGSILANLVSLLITLNDLLIERSATAENNFSKIFSIIDAILHENADFLSYIKISELSPTAIHLRSNGISLPLLETSIVNKNQIMTHMRDNYSKYTKISLHVEKIQRFFAIDDDTSAQDLEMALTEVINLFLKSPNFISVEQTLLLIENASKNYSNKEKFVEIFLSAYKNIYDSYMRKDPKKNTLLENTSKFFPMLDKLLVPGKLSELMTENINKNNDQYLGNPRAGEHDRSFDLYETFLSFYVDIERRQVIYNQVSENSIRHLSLVLEMGDYLYPHLQVAGRNIADSIQLLTSPDLSQLPPLLQTKLFNLFAEKPELQAEFEAFIKLFLRVNSNADEHQKKDLKLFFSKHQEAIMQIVGIMGTDGIRFLRSHLAVTTLNLERMLSNLPILPEIAQTHLKTYCQEHAISFQKKPKEIQTIVTSMTVLGMLIDISHESINEYLLLSNDKSPEDFMLLLSKALLQKVFDDIQVEFTSQEIAAIFNRITPEKLVSLIAASKKMSQDEYRDVYLNLLKLDLTGGNIDNFLHNMDQEDDIGKGLAYHNNKIRKRLKEAEIVPETALNYTKTLNFVVTPSSNETIDQAALFQVLGLYIQKLKEAIDKIDAGTRSPELSKLVGFIEKLKDEQGKFVSLNTTSSGTLGEINTSLNVLAKSDVSLSDGFKEFSEHVRTQYELIKKSKRTQKQKTEEYFFCVEQWKKYKIDTFFLGDAVGCCLATNNAQFQAIVQRRMDDAMLFHVAIDQATGKPAALIWLYLAETTDKKIVLVANFFEVNTKYAINDTLRLALLNGLLQFTHQYCQDNPNIDAFYMNQLSYGWNKDDLDHYERKEITLSDKLGGPYIPGMSVKDIEDFQEQLLESNKQNTEMCSQIKQFTQQKYYLVSLSQNQFHLFDPAKLVPVRTIKIEQAVEQESAALVLRGLQDIQKQPGHHLFFIQRSQPPQAKWTLPSAATLIKQHGLLSVTKDGRVAREQHEQDKKWGLVTVERFIAQKL